MTPSNPLEGENTFKQDFLNFRILDLNLRQTKEINPMHELKKRVRNMQRESFSNVKLPTIDQSTLVVGRRK